MRVINILLKTISGFDRRDIVVIWNYPYPRSQVKVNTPQRKYFHKPHQDIKKFVAVSEQNFIPHQSPSLPYSIIIQQPTGDETRQEFVIIFPGKSKSRMK